MDQQETLFNRAKKGEERRDKQGGWRLQDVYIIRTSPCICTRNTKSVWAWCYILCISFGVNRWGQVVWVGGQGVGWDGGA